MQAAMDETRRRRKIQHAYNQQHNITPQTIRKEVTQVFDFGKEIEAAPENEVAESLSEYKTLEDMDAVIRSFETEMQAAVKALEFERAAELRDQIQEFKKLIVFEA